MNPGADLSGSRFGAIFYPRVEIGQTPIAHQFFDLGASCSDIITDYNSMIDAFYNQEFENDFLDFVRGEGTYPAVSISKLTRNIEQAISEGESKWRRRIVVIITDGNNDGETDELIQAVHDLIKVAPGITILAAGNDDTYRFEPHLAQRFREELTLIADGNPNNVVIRRESTLLAVALVKKMKDVQAICDEPG